jgi:ABC-type phosphate transport system substrate-binding protein
MRRRILLTGLIWASLSALATVEVRSSTTGFRVIVNPANPAASVERRFLVDAFLKKTTRWPHDEQIRPCDLDPESATRRRFSDDVLKRSVAAVKSYWQQMVFSGQNVPPPEFDSDEQVIQFVLRNPGAVGYVSASANIEGAKVLSLR